MTNSLALQGERDQLTATVSTLKEKVAIVENVEALQEELPAVIGACINAYHLLHGETVEEQKNTIEMQKKELSENEETMKSLAVWVLRERET